MRLDKTNNKAGLRVGGRVQVNDSEDNFFRQVGNVKSVGQATCGVDIDGYFVAYFPKQLTPLD
jgi:hypothetical protein